MSDSSVTVALTAEIERLRSLVGPSETGYASLVRDRDEAHVAARSAVLEAGDLRGHIAEMQVQLSRARQDQDLLQRRIEMTPAERWFDRVRMRWATSVAPRIRRVTRRRSGE